MIAALVFAAVQGAPLEVRAQQRDGDLVCTVQARAARLGDIVARLAEVSGRGVQGLDDTRARTSLDVDLRERTVEQALRIVAGCAGLDVRIDATTIAFEAAPAAVASQERLDEAAESAWLRAVRAFPEHKRAADAHWQLGLAEERRGGLDAARTHYEIVAKDFYASDAAPQALLHCAGILEQGGEWSDAAEAWSRLANRGGSNPWQAEARIGLARAWAKKGDGNLALSLLESLDRLDPVAGQSAHIDRLRVKALALHVAGRQAEAAAALDTAARLDPSLSETVDTLELRASIASASGDLGEAARLWFAAANRTDGETRSRLMVLAADAAREDGDHAGLLFLERVAKGTSAAPAIERLAADARAQIGLDGGVAQLAAPARLERGLELRAAGECERAVVVLEPLVGTRNGLDAAQWLQAVEGAARCADAAHGIDRAIALLRAAAPLAGIEEQRRLCAIAGDLYESRELWDRAADAFGGRL